NGTAMFDLSLSVEEGDQGLRVTLEYNTDLFEEGTILRLLGHWRSLLEAIVADPACRLSALPLLSGDERQTLLVAFNATAADYPRAACLHHLVADQVERTPAAVAVACGPEELSYRELDRRSNQLAHQLRGLGVGPGALVGLCVERSVAMVVGLLGVLKAGGAYVPLDPSYPRDRLAFMLDDAQVPLVLTQQRLMDRLAGHRARVLSLASDQQTLPCEAEAKPACLATPLDPAYVVYTSGSTGRPNGVVIAHRALVNHSLAIAKRFGLQASDRVLQFASLSFDVA